MTVLPVMVLGILATTSNNSWYAFWETHRSDICLHTRYMTTCHSHSRRYYNYDCYDRQQNIMAAIPMRLMTSTTVTTTLADIATTAAISTRKLPKALHEEVKPYTVDMYQAIRARQSTTRKQKHNMNNPTMFFDTAQHQCWRIACNFLNKFCIHPPIMNTVGGMQTTATPKWLPSHLAVNSGHVTIGKEILRKW